MSPSIRMAPAPSSSQATAGHGKTKSGRSSSAVRPALLAIAVSVMVVLLMAVLFGARWTPSGGHGGAADTSWVSAGARVVLNAVSSQQGADPVVKVAQPHDRLLGGLLSPDFNDTSCLSRYRASLYRRRSLHVLSSHLVSALRRYESLHRLCGPGTSAYERAVARLRSPSSSNTTSDAPSECRYLVWTPHAGLGNRMLSITSAFLYALLTGRVLLLHRPGDDMNDLFCEPFPGTTWILPEKDFPIRGMERFGIRTRESLGNALGRGEGGRDPPPPWMYVHLRHDYTRPGARDRLFFCDDGQDALRRVGWVVLLSDNYFVPGLFLIPRFDRELSRMFPRRDAVFHHLGRYLFHPSNTVWGMVMRYHGSYLAKAEERVGVQVRTFAWAPISTDELYGQIVSCAHGENILPRVRESGSDNATAIPGSGRQQQRRRPARRKAVLVVSLHGEYYERIRDMYYEHGAAGGDAVSVFQPTHLGGQRSEERMHNQKALAEMMLLSFSDVALTSAASTFGYVSHGLAGLRPWVLMVPVRKKAPNPPCRLAATVEPCFHTPPHYDCQARTKGDNGKTVRHVRHCEDLKDGVQLVD
uniref:Fucosyltransferase n=1 Tax=Oryza meridionalis TaxID=40149 RepID=A0A0E0DEX6_9ORYZ